MGSEAYGRIGMIQHWTNLRGSKRHRDTRLDESLQDLFSSRLVAPRLRTGQMAARIRGRSISRSRIVLVSVLRCIPSSWAVLPK